MPPSLRKGRKAFERSSKDVKNGVQDWIASVVPPSQ